MNNFSGNHVEGGGECCLVRGVSMTSRKRNGDSKHPCFTLVLNSSYLLVDHHGLLVLFLYL